MEAPGASLDPFGVRIASSSVAYADGAEERVLAALLDSVDRSDGSDELAARISDWPTRYHFSPLRANLLRPLRVRPDLRVLDLGCGTGTLTRWLGEQRARVLGVEGSLPRARAAAVRCAGLHNVEIMAGTVDDIPDDELFDLVVMVGVLEYGPVFLGGPEGSDKLLEAARRHLAAGGALVLAIENQLGLKYLLGYGEDHLGLAWVGVEGYPSGSGPRTWSRTVLRGMLERSRLPAQRWLFPFPDYKLPSVVLDELLYRHPAGKAAIDHLVRTPVTSDATSPSLVCDVRLAHRQFLDAGLGPEVANSFLIVAAEETAHLHDLVGNELAWLFGDLRRAQWRRTRVILAEGAGLAIEDRSDLAQTRRLGWLTQAVRPGSRRPFLPGDPLDLVLRQAIRRGDLGRVQEYLTLWRREFDRHGDGPSQKRAIHPFEPKTEGDLALPGEFLDVSPSNFVLQDEGLGFIDGEWVTTHPVSAQLVQIRGIWWFSRDLVLSGEPHPWGQLTSVDEICQSLCELAGIECPSPVLNRWRRAEAELQHLVVGGDRRSIENQLKSDGRHRTIDVSPRVLPFTSLRAALDASRREAEAATAKSHQLEDRIAAAETALELARAELAQLQTESTELEARSETTERALEELRAEAERLERGRLQDEQLIVGQREEIGSLRAALELWVARMNAIERRFLVRLYRRWQQLKRSI